MTANELNASTGSSVQIADKLLDAAEGAASQDQVTYLTGDSGRRYAAIVPVEAADEYQKRFESAPSGVNTIGDPYSEQQVRLGHNTLVQFGDTEDGAWFAQLNDHGELTIRFHSMGAEQALAVLPRSGNSVTLRKAMS